MYSRHVDGTIVNCLRAPIFPTPELSETIESIQALSSVRIYPDESTDDFYKVVTVWGLDGYIPKIYVAI